nr:hypothetical protein [uncultured Rhodopila sp.]
MTDLEIELLKKLQESHEEIGRLRAILPATVPVPIPISPNTLPPLPYPWGPSPNTVPTYPLTHYGTDIVTC